MRGVGYLLIIAVAASFASGCVSTDWEARYLEKEMEARALQEQYDAMNQNLAERDASSEVLRQEFDETRAQLDTLSGELEKLKEQASGFAQYRQKKEEELKAALTKMRQLEAAYS